MACEHPSAVPDPGTHLGGEVGRLKTEVGGRNMSELAGEKCCSGGFSVLPPLRLGSRASDAGGETGAGSVSPGASLLPPLHKPCSQLAPSIARGGGCCWLLVLPWERKQLPWGLGWRDRSWL